jgi:SAM-dependent methyltransferase
LRRLAVLSSLAALKLSAALGVFKPYQPIRELRIHSWPNRDEGVQARWAAIRSELPAEPVSILDIGCNIGFYVVESAKLGHFAAGLDSPTYAHALTTVKNALRLDNVMPVGLRLNPENVSSLPQFDCVIMLQVFHHLCAAYGTQSGMAMLREIYGKARREMFFETEPNYDNHEPFSSALPDMGGDSEAWVRCLFSELGCRDARVIYRQANRKRAVFVVEK